MKEFIVIFIACYIGIYVMLSFVYNIFALIALIAFVVAALITVIVKQGMRIDELEENVKRLIDTNDEKRS